MPRNYDLASRPPTAGQRRPEHTRDEEWVRAFLRVADVGHLASAWDDQPFVIPTSFWFDEANHRIVFHSNLAGRMRANLERNPKACLEASEMGRLLPAARRAVRPAEKILPRNGAGTRVPSHHGEGVEADFRL
ncbi:MAG: hypothetical protein DCC54_05495 [Anaerolineae bacterium]|nr:MAG: hypothetical protein DCC54_05495 [Anaerolineae bacterium]